MIPNEVFCISCRARVTVPPPPRLATLPPQLVVTPPPTPGIDRVSAFGRVYAGGSTPHRLRQVEHHSGARMPCRAARSQRRPATWHRTQTTFNWKTAYHQLTVSTEKIHFLQSLFFSV